jgi:DNA-binding GntR family transcriptional regulator
VPFIKLRTLTHQVYQNLKDRITNRQIHPGTQLIVHQIAQELGVSSTPVREAFRLLEKEGLLRNVPHCNAVVIEQSRKDFEEMFAVRRTLEMLAVRAACEQLVESDLTQLAGILEEGQTCVRQKHVEGWIKADENFHRLISEKCGNKILKQMLDMLLDRMRIYRMLTAWNQPGIEMAVQEHEAIFSAIKSRDAARAEELMSKHIEKSLLIGIEEGVI